MIKKKELPVLTPSPLPPLYAAWMDQLLAGPIPRETDATCDDCAMCSTETSPRAGSEIFYNPATKCCTYIPALPNFLVGRILSDDDPALARGRKTVDERLRSRLGVTPLGIEMPLAYEFLYQHASAKAFGRSEALLCPHYVAEESGRCGIWKHRPGVCATWHCKYVRGAVGSKFWQSLLQLLGVVEESLSRWCVYTLEIEVEGLRVLFPPKGSLGLGQQVDSFALDGKVDAHVYEQAWGKWLGREEEFYKQAARLVNGLDWQGVVSIGGTEIKIRERLVQDTYSQLNSHELPPALIVGSLKVLSMGRESTRVMTYSLLDPLDLPVSLMAVLPYFDGRQTTDAMAAIETQEGISLSPDLVRKLVDFDILVASTTQSES